jgi:small conductance mechanosensitive channel
MTLRTTLLRDIEGVLHIVPNGEVKSIRNHTHGWSQVKLDVAVGYEADLDQVMASLRETGEALHRDPRFGAMIIEPPEVLGVESFGDSQVLVRVIVKTRAERQLEVAREFRRRIRESFRGLGVEPPYPHRVILGLPAGGEGAR